MSHTTQRLAVGSTHGQRSRVMAVLLAASALAILAVALLTRPADQLSLPAAQESAVQEADGTPDTAVAPRQREDWHANYNMVRR
jgi:hypothetical protein